MLDSVDAYNRIAPVFRALAEKRAVYCSRIDSIITLMIPAESRSLLDVGAGDGSRGSRIAIAAGCKDIVLVEPSREMGCVSQHLGAKILPIRAEALDLVEGSFDVIICLWNVLGHILPSAKRQEVFCQFRRLLSAKGKIFIDVSHRYNLHYYGLLPTAIRFLRDVIHTSADGEVNWEVAGKRCSTRVHFLSDHLKTGHT